MIAPTPRSSRRALAIALVALPLAAFSARDTATARSLVASGVTFTYKMSAMGGSAPSVPRIESVVRMSPDGIRMDYQDAGKAANPMAGKNGYMVIRGSPPTFAIVNTEKKQVLVMSAGALGGGLGALTNNPLVRMKTSNETFKYEVVGDGPEILGYKTRHIRLTTGQTMEMRVLFKNEKSTSSTVMDSYVADIGLDDRIAKVWTKSFSSGLQTTNPDLLTEIDKYAAEVAKGVTLRSDMVTTTKDSKGTRTDSMRVEVIDLKKGDIDKSIFENPAGYEVVDMTAAAEAATAKVDSANKAEGKQAADSAKQESAGDAVKQGLKGMNPFKRKKP